MMSDKLKQNLAFLTFAVKDRCGDSAEGDDDTNSSSSEEPAVSLLRFFIIAASTIEYRTM